MRGCDSANSRLPPTTDAPARACRSVGSMHPFCTRLPLPRIVPFLPFPRMRENFLESPYLRLTVGEKFLIRLLWKVGRHQIQQ